MAENIFNKIQALRSSAGIPERGPAAQDWFRQTVRQMFGDRPLRGREQLILAEDAKLRTAASIQQPGRMFMFVYDPKFRKTLPYYDRFPMIFVLELYQDGFLGLNLHYLPHKLRARLYNKLQVLRNTQNMNENTRLRLSYGVIKNATKYHSALPLIRHYKTKYIRSRLLEVHPRDWEIALFLPAEQFKKRGKHTIWAITREEVREQQDRTRKSARLKREAKQKLRDQQRLGFTKPENP